MGVVQGTSHPEHVVMDAVAVSGHLLPSGSVFAFLAGHRRELFPDSMFADLFPSPLGRPSVPADVVAAVLVLQALEGRSDREAVEALTFDLRWDDHDLAGQAPAIPHALHAHQLQLAQPSRALVRLHH